MITVAEFVNKVRMNNSNSEDKLESIRPINGLVLLSSDSEKYAVISEKNKILGFSRDSNLPKLIAELTVKGEEVLGIHELPVGGKGK